MTTSSTYYLDLILLIIVFRSSAIILIGHWRYSYNTTNTEYHTLFSTIRLYILPRSSLLAVFCNQSWLYLPGEFLSRLSATRRLQQFTDFILNAGSTVPVCVFNLLWSLHRNSIKRELQLSAATSSSLL